MVYRLFCLRVCKDLQVQEGFGFRVGNEERRLQQLKRKPGLQIQGKGIRLRIGFGKVGG